MTGTEKGAGGAWKAIPRISEKKPACSRRSSNAAAADAARSSSLPVSVFFHGIGDTHREKYQLQSSTAAAAAAAAAVMHFTQKEEEEKEGEKS